jgi:hypothetical protein
MIVIQFRKSTGVFLVKNTKKTLLMSVAALIVGAGVAAAQAPSPAPAAQQAAPAEKMAPVHPVQEPKGEPKGAAKTKAPGDGLKSGQADDTIGRKGDRAQHAQDAPKDEMKSKDTSPETKSPGRTSADTKSDVKPMAGDQTGAKPSEKTSEKADAKASTSGQGVAGEPANLSPEQRTTVHTVIRQQNVQPMTSVDFSVSVGAQVPSSVQFHRVPAELVHLYPHWSGYEYFVVGDQVVVVDPRTHQIVAVIDA